MPRKLVTSDRPEPFYAKDEVCNELLFYPDEKELYPHPSLIWRPNAGEMTTADIRKAIVIMAHQHEDLAAKNLPKILGLSVDVIQTMMDDYQDILDGQPGRMRDKDKERERLEEEKQRALRRWRAYQAAHAARAAGGGRKTEEGTGAAEEKIGDKELVTELLLKPKK